MAFPRKVTAFVRARITAGTTVSVANIVIFELSLSLYKHSRHTVWRDFANYTLGFAIFMMPFVLGISIIYGSVAVVRNVIGWECY